MSVENFIFGRKKWANLLPPAVEQHKGEPDDFFPAEGVTAEELAQATFNRAFEAAFLKKYGGDPALPEAAAQRPDIDTITPALT